MASTSLSSVSGVSGVDEEARMILKSLDEFIEREVRPIEEDLGETIRNPRKRVDEDGFLKDEVVDAYEEVRQRSADAGFFAMNLPEEVGGGGVSNVTWYLANVHNEKKNSSLRGEVLATAKGPKPLLLQAEGDQVETYLTPTVEGEKSTAFGQTEPGGGSDSPGMKTRAEKDGDEYVINGRKQWITNAPYADFIQLFARTTPLEEADHRYHGITCFIVERDEYEIGALNHVPGSPGEQAEVVLDDVRVPEDRILGEEDLAFANAMEFLTLGRLELAAKSVGASKFLIERAIDYATEREAFGEPIGQYQQVSSMIAESRAKQFAAHSTGLRIARMIDDGEEDLIEESSILKWLATNVYWEVADDVVQVHGASGLAEDNPFMEHVHQARVMRIGEGTDEIQLNTIARQHGLLQR